MRLRPYISSKDYTYIEKWVNDERIHALWCAGLVPYPLSEQELSDFINQDAKEWGGSAYIITDDDGTPIGFFMYSINTISDSGFLKFVVLNNELRGKGYGTQMLRLMLKYAFEITGVSEVRINVFDVNSAALRCYSKVGFTAQSMVKDAFTYKDEQWGRLQMVISQPQGMESSDNFLSNMV